MAEGVIEYDGVSKHFGDVVAVDDVSFTVQDGELLALLGPSGSGKTTTLRMLAGFENPTTGRIFLRGTDVVGIPPHKRNTGMVFQDYALFPHMTVGENIAFGLKRHGVPSEAIDSRVEEALAMVDLAGFEDRQPSNLSGGQQQRVATARAIAIEPEVLLMDEPLGALDKKLRDQLQIELRNLQQELGITTLYVTHNQEEALTMADRVAVMNQGRIEQIAAPSTIYDDPATEFVADFIGDTNFLPGSLAEADGETRLRVADREIRVAEPDVPLGDGVVFVRPEKLTVNGPGHSVDDANALPGRVEQVVFLGSKIRYVIETNATELVAEEENRTGKDVFSEGDDVVVTWDAVDTRVARG